jgi:hypothetical protein
MIDWGSAPDWITALAAMGALIGGYLTIRAKREDDRRADRLNRINRQLSDFYGKLSIVYEAGTRDWCSFIVHTPLASLPATPEWPGAASLCRGLCEPLSRGAFGLRSHVEFPGLYLSAGRATRCASGPSLSPRWKRILLALGCGPASWTGLRLWRFSGPSRLSTGAGEYVGSAGKHGVLDQPGAVCVCQLLPVAGRRFTEGPTLSPTQQSGLTTTPEYAPLICLSVQCPPG